MKITLKSLLFIVCIHCVSAVYSQYTDVINSNRPGNSMSAFAVGKRVYQLETGFSYKSLEHKGFNNSQVEGFQIDGMLRAGLFSERLELIWDFSYHSDELTNATVMPAITEKRSGFLRNVIGAKFLVFDPVKEEDKQINIRSWDANHGFHWRNMIPAVSVYAGANFFFGDNPYQFSNQYNLNNVAFYANLEEPQISPKVLIATQSNFLPFWALITNFSYNRIGTDYPEFGYTLTVTHAFQSNPRFSIFLENQGFDSEIYADNLMKLGFAYLISKNFQFDLNFGTSLKNTPSQNYGGFGIAVRLDRHKDELKTSEQKANKELSEGKKKKKKKKKRKKGLDKLEDSIETPEE